MSRPGIPRLLRDVGFLLVLSASLAGVGSAQVGGVHLTLEPYVGYMDWSKHVNLDEQLVFGGRLGFWANAYLGLEGFLGFSSTETESGPRPWPDESGESFDQDLTLYGADLILNGFPSRAVNPFVFVGWQEGRLAENDGWDGVTYENGAQAGAGIFIRLRPRMALRAEARDIIWKFDDPGSARPNGRSSNNMLYSLGLSLALGGHVMVDDEDGDGVTDDKDRCPGTPAGTPVGPDGCPLDSDGDGVSDDLDKCPDTQRGCRVDAQGCPSDSDGDKVCDGLDQCADTMAGCSVDSRGCPTDSDGDGVCDGLDKCPDTDQGLVVDPDGCPIEVSEKETELLDTGMITARNVNFETAKWALLPESQAVLDEIGSILIKWPELRVEVGGHTDARGSEAYNLTLSDKRANAVREYLLAKFPQIKADQYTAKGYGELKPIASNDTVEGMAQNRRVEFKVLNTEVLKKERERREMLKKK